MWLTLTVIMTGLMWVPYIVDRAMVRGLKGCMANPSRNDKPQSAWAQRLYFAHTNAVENLIIFAPLVLILDAQGLLDRVHRHCLRGLFLGKAGARHPLHDGRPGSPHACFLRRLSCTGRARIRGVRKTLVRRTGTFGDAARIQAARQQPEDRRPLAIEPRCAKCIRHFGWRVPDQQRTLKSDNEVAHQRARL